MELKNYDKRKLPEDLEEIFVKISIYIKEKVIVIWHLLSPLTIIRAFSKSNDFV